jgi:hypothetical protein
MASLQSGIEQAIAAIKPPTTVASSGETNNTNNDNKPIPPAPGGQSGWMEPPSPFNEDPELGPVNKPVYPHNQVISSKSGHALHMDDTKGAERIRLEHRTATFLEMHPDGSQVNKIQGDSYEIVAKNNNVLIKGSCNITVIGDCVIECQNKIEKINGDYNLQVAGKFTVMAGDMIVHSDKDVEITAGSGTVGVGNIQLSSADGVFVKGKLTALNSFYADEVYSNTKVTAKFGMISGHLGFLSRTGGLFLGCEAVIPGVPDIPPIVAPPFSPGVVVNGAGVFTDGFMIAAIAVAAPVIQGLYTRDLFGSMAGIRIEHNLHTHPVLFGPTGPPIPQMYGMLI